MKTNTDLQLIREKIYQIRSALMYSMSNDLVKISNNIVSVLRVDDEGQLWFLCKKPHYPVEQCETSFPVRLVFYRKGISFYLEVSGKATIVKEENDLLESLQSDSRTEKPVLVKMTVQNLEITESGERRKNRFDLILDHTYKWLSHTIAFTRHEKSVLEKLPHLN